MAGSSLAARLRPAPPLQLRVQLLDGSWLLSRSTFDGSEPEAAVSEVDAAVAAGLLRVSTSDGAERWVPAHAVLQVELRPAP